MGDRFQRGYYKGSRFSFPGRPVRGGWRGCFSQRSGTAGAVPEACSLVSGRLFFVRCRYNVEGNVVRRAGPASDGDKESWSRRAEGVDADAGCN